MAGPVTWELRNVSKAFGPVLANDGVSIALREGQIHGLLGENGSGKSTLINTLSGVHQPDRGEILHDGRAVRLATPLVARSLGIATVFQEFSLVPHLSVAENILLGRWPGHALRLDWRGMHAAASRILGEMGLALAVEQPVAALSGAEQQLVEIAKAMAQQASTLILDEPTTALASREVEHLFALLRRLRDGGVTILYVSHRLDEVVRLVDVATIMRNGRVVSSAEETLMDVPQIVSRMVGQEITSHYPRQRNATAVPLLEVRRLATATGVIDASFTVHRGEVLGLGGLLGSGRTEIVRAVFGADPLTGGEVRVSGRTVRFSAPGDAIAAGIALLTENRKTDGLFLNFDSCCNITIANLASLLQGPRLDLVRERTVARGLIQRLRVVPSSGYEPVDRLSGGNQQKVVIGRWLHAEAEIFLLDEPTRGIDIGAKVAIYHLINELTAAGKAVVLISSDDEELLSMSDRIAVVRRGQVVRIADAGTISKSDLLRQAEPEAAA